jgi:ribosomal protein S18 acetylase RimI-like enzyme
MDRRPACQSDERAGGAIPTDERTISDGSQLTVVRITDSQDARLEPLLSIYEMAIPLRERKSEAALRAMASSPVHRVFAASKAGRMLGFCALYAGKVALLEYLAVDEAARGHGVGAELYRRGRDTLESGPLLVEVESDREDVADRALRSRRIAFYRRLGCRRLKGLEFIFPLRGAGAPPKIDILVDAFPGASVPGALAAEWLREIYDAVYECPPDDRRLIEMLGALPPELPLE